MFVEDSSSAAASGDMTALREIAAGKVGVEMLKKVPV
jgi:hypothetical protein